MSMLSLMKKFANASYDKLAPNLGTMFLVTGTIGWILSSFAHITAVVINPKIPSDQKKFLIPQELADAAVNIASFVLVTNAFTKHGEKLVNSCKMMSPAIKKFVQENGLAKLANEKNFNITATDTFKKNKAFQKEYYKFFDGVSFISSTLGSIISCNILTPILRNPLAAMEQKRTIKRQKEADVAKMQSITEKPNTDNYSQKSAFAKVNFSSKLNSNMKI